MQNDVTIESIAKEIKVARINNLKLRKSPQELAEDMLIVITGLTSDLEKYLEKGMDAPAKRARAKTKLLETLGKSFRVQSVK